MTPFTSGLLVLHGNRLEQLRDAVFDWIAAHPLDPLEDEVILVQSNAAAEWIKIALAERAGVCAATRVSLPARFVWTAYRRVLGADRLAERSALDRDALVWRLMRLLPARLHQAIFAPIAAYLADGDVARRLQLAEKLADLYDAYQVYRPDWLDAWEAQRNVLVAADGRERSLQSDDLWQAALWRDLVRELDPHDRAMTRPAVHRAFVEALDRSRIDETVVASLPRRVVLFGASHLPPSSLEALARLSSVVQVVIAVPNPCRFHWADIIDGCEAWRTRRRRHRSRDARVDLAMVASQDMHHHAHPLLAAWGRQGRDFMRQLDAFDEAEAARERFDVARSDLFDEAPGTTLLEQVQAAIRDLLPLEEHPRAMGGKPVDSADRSIVFHVAHGAQREIEILHDQLLDAFASRERTDRPLRPRDVIVMVPDIELFAPAIRAVFGQYAKDDARYIPHAIADLRTRGSNPLVVAIEWLLRVDEHRAGIGELRDLFDVPAIAARFGLAVDDVRRVFAWADAANVRWGLGAAHRAALGLDACGAQTTWDFGLARLLLGHASGAGASFDGVAAVDEVGGLETAAVGALAECVERLEQWRRTSQVDAMPAEWATRCRALLAVFVAATDERERVTGAALEDALASWLDACDAAGFDEAVPIDVAREGWLARLEGLETQRRFLSGGVTFCTLLPLRAVPFDVVCLVGLDDQAYPRPVRRDDFDLAQRAGLQRPGDRSRRDDDRYLMLEALLSARSLLYLSWSGRSARDNSLQPPSVLVSQLRDYLDAGWTGPAGTSVVEPRTTHHPLQPFSRRYFEARDTSGLFTYAREWRDAHRTERAGRRRHDSRAVATVHDGSPLLSIRRLRSFLRNPIVAYFRDRLDVAVPRDDDPLVDDEAFDLRGLARWELVTAIVRDASGVEGRSTEACVDACLASVAASGCLPLLDGGARELADLRTVAIHMLAWRRRLERTMPRRAPRVRLRVERRGVVVDDWLDGLRVDRDDRIATIEVKASKLVDGDEIERRHLVDAWVSMLVAVVAGHPVRSYVVGCNGVVVADPLAFDEASRALDALLDAWRTSSAADRPLPVTSKTALAELARSQGRERYEGAKRSGGDGHGEADRDFAVGRAYPTFDALRDEGFAHWADVLYAPMHAWVNDHVRLVMDDDADDDAHDDAGSSLDREAA